jgi:hypothetical protein
MGWGLALKGFVRVGMDGWMDGVFDVCMCCGQKRSERKGIRVDGLG